MFSGVPRKTLYACCSAIRALIIRFSQSEFHKTVFVRDLNLLVLVGFDGFLCERDRPTLVDYGCEGGIDCKRLVEQMFYPIKQYQLHFVRINFNLKLTHRNLFDKQPPHLLQNSKFKRIFHHTNLASNSMW